MEDHNYTRENQIEQLPKDAINFINQHYYYDSDIDVSGIIGETWTGDVETSNFYNPGEIIFSLKHELKKRPKRKRKYLAMWEKLEAMGLAQRP